MAIKPSETLSVGDKIIFDLSTNEYEVIKVPSCPPGCINIHPAYLRTPCSKPAACGLCSGAKIQECQCFTLKLVKVVTPSCTSLSVGEHYHLDRSIVYTDTSKYYKWGTMSAVNLSMKETVDALKSSVNTLAVNCVCPTLLNGHHAGCFYKEQ